MGKILMAKRHFRAPKDGADLQQNRLKIVTIRMHTDSRRDDETLVIAVGQIVKHTDRRRDDETLVIAVGTGSETQTDGETTKLLS